MLKQVANLTFKKIDIKQITCVECKLAEEDNFNLDYMINKLPVESMKQ